MVKLDKRLNITQKIIQYLSDKVNETTGNIIKAPKKMNLEQHKMTNDKIMNSLV